jgi:glycosyltransferase involved in cell wall biosynthesis
MYNMADVTVNIASNEGFGLSGAESLMTGTPIINNVTGGLQDHMRFEDERGDWIEFTTDIPSNHDGTYKKCGKWAKPVFRIR